MDPGGTQQHTWPYLQSHRVCTLLGLPTCDGQVGDLSVPHQAAHMVTVALQHHQLTRNSVPYPRCLVIAARQKESLQQSSPCMGSVVEAMLYGICGAQIAAMSKTLSRAASGHAGRLTHV